MNIIRRTDNNELLLLKIPFFYLTMTTIQNCYHKPVIRIPTIYIGYDYREHQAMQVLHYSIRKLSSKPINVVTLNQLNLRRIGLYRRAPHTASTCWGQPPEANMLDCFDERPLSTEFSFSRFLTPFVNLMEGYALFMDSDMYFRFDPQQLFEFVGRPDQQRYALWCVKHNYQPDQTKKMYGCPQSSYSRKNWSSFVVWNCSHPAHQKLTVDDVNTKPGRWLHQFGWLQEEEIGSLPEEWNFLDGHTEESLDAKNVHFTTGGPWFSNWKPSRPKDQQYVAEWYQIRREMEAVDGLLQLRHEKQQAVNLI